MWRSHRRAGACFRACRCSKTWRWARSSTARSDPDDLARVFDLFPRLKERIDQKAGTMSGGEQQMLAIGRALMAKPELLLLDEPSMGLSPILVETDLRDRQGDQRQGTTVLAGRAERLDGAWRSPIAAM